MLVHLVFVDKFEDDVMIIPKPFKVMFNETS